MFPILFSFLLIYFILFVYFFTHSFIHSLVCFSFLPSPHLLPQGFDRRSLHPAYFESQLALKAINHQSRGQVSTVLVGYPPEKTQHGCHNSLFFASRTFSLSLILEPSFRLLLIHYLNCINILYWCYQPVYLRIPFFVVLLSVIQQKSTLISC